jgi:hypothetical protein
MKKSRCLIQRNSIMKRKQTNKMVRLGLRKKKMHRSGHGWQNTRDLRMEIRTCSQDHHLPMDTHPLAILTTLVITIIITPLIRTGRLIPILILLQGPMTTLLSILLQVVIHQGVLKGTVIIHPHPIMDTSNNLDHRCNGTGDMKS